MWPLLLRIALPFTVATLGLGALALNAALLLGAAGLLDDVRVDDFWTALGIVLGLTLLTTLLGGVLALDRGDLWYRHIVRRQLKRSQLAIRTDVPGVIFLEIDGLAHDILRRALRDGNAPFLARWVHDDGYHLHGWETDWSSQTGACQAGLLHGDNHDMPAFRWWEKDADPPRAIVTNHPKDAAEIERRHSDGKGLLHEDGASRANILSGDAAHSMLTMSTVLDRSRPGRLGQDYFAYFASPYGCARTLLRTIGEFAIERFSAIQQVQRDVQPRVHRGWSYAAVRAFGTVIQLDLQVAAVTADILAGRPVGLHDVPGLRRGRAPQRPRAAGHAGGAAARGPGDRDDRRRRAARAAAVQARRAERSRAVAGRDVPAALRRVARGHRAPLRRGRGARRGRRLRRGAGDVQRGRRRARDRATPRPATWSAPRLAIVCRTSRTTAGRSRTCR